LEWLFSQTQGDPARYRRQTFATLLNNWSGEIEKAREWKSGHRNGDSHLSAGAKLKQERSRGLCPENIEVPITTIE
jgi:hypothetical protein